jgi:hypothetical protein
MSRDCNKTKERLEELVDQIVDAGLIGQEIDPSQLSLTSDYQEHLVQCADCRDYQLANRILIEAAAALPLLEIPQADLLTASIMHAVMEEPVPEAAATALSDKEASTDKSITATSNFHNNRYGEISLVAISFVAFALASAYGVQLDESLWNIGSWLIALMVFIALKPLIEHQQLEHLQLGTPA